MSNNESEENKACVKELQEQQHEGGHAQEVSAVLMS
jgi:hypothetical protein